MKILHLHLKEKYFYEILAGTKKEEYRLVKPYWTRILLNREYKLIRVYKAFPPCSDNQSIIDFPFRGYEIKTITHEEFGPDPVEVYAIKLEMNENQREFIAISIMIELAKQEMYLLPEVILTFGNFRKQGYNVEEAVNHALREWDL